MPSSGYFRLDRVTPSAVPLLQNTDRYPDMVLGKVMLPPSRIQVATVFSPRKKTLGSMAGQPVQKLQVSQGVLQPAA